MVNEASSHTLNNDTNKILNICLLNEHCPSWGRIWWKTGHNPVFKEWLIMQMSKGLWLTLVLTFWSLGFADIRDACAKGYLCPKKTKIRVQKMLFVQYNVQDLHSGLCKGNASWCLLGFGKTLQLSSLGKFSSKCWSAACCLSFVFKWWEKPYNWESW